MTSKSYILLAVPKSLSPEADHIIERSIRKKSQLTNKIYLNRIKFGSLDELMSINDELVRTDNNFATICKRFLPYVKEYFEETWSIATRFSWDYIRYGLYNKLTVLVDQIKQDMVHIEQDFKVKAKAYSVKLTELKNEDRRKEAPFISRPVEHLVKDNSSCYVQTEYLTTLFVAVRNKDVKIWEKRYEKMLDLLMDDEVTIDEEDDATEGELWYVKKIKFRMEQIRQGQWIVPRSSLKVASDKEWAIFRVVMFRELETDFRRACQLIKIFVVRDFNPNFDFKKLEEKKKVFLEEEQEFFEWCRNKFTSAFSIWMHIKVIMLNTEMLIRYGPDKLANTDLDPNQVYVIECQQKDKMDLLFKLDYSFRDLLPKQVYSDRDRVQDLKNGDLRCHSANLSIIDLG